MTDALILPRRLAIALLAEAQKAGESPVSGVIGARDGVPVSVRPAPGGAASGESVWAHYRSGTGAPDARGGRQLLISIDTKGVLQLRCWDAGAECELRIL
jgi:hypothetical protein